MLVKALLFASLRDVAGDRCVETELDEGSTVADLSAALVARFPPLAERLRTVRVAVNDSFAELSRVLQAGDEVAYLPPVSGGSDDAWVEVTDREISIDAVLRSVRRPDCGAVVLFLGTVRNNFQGAAVMGMEYEAHAALAHHAIQEIVTQVRRNFEVGAIAVVHRIGRLDLCDVSVAVAVASPHRAAAFEAGRFVIDTLKQTVPIWKRELLEDGAVWIEGEERIPAK